MTHALRAYRSENGISLDEMAKAVGTTKASLSRIENARQSPSLGLISRIVAATNGAVSANDFFPTTEPAR